MSTHRLEPGPDNVHWGYFDATLPPRLAIESGERVTITTVSGGPDMMPRAAAGDPAGAARHPPEGHAQVWGRTSAPARSP